MGVAAADDLFSYIEADMTPVVAMLMGRGRRPALPLPPARILTTADAEAGVSVPLMALGDRPVRSWVKTGCRINDTSRSGNFLLIQA